MVLTKEESRYLSIEWSDATKFERRNTEWARWPEIVQRLQKWRKSPENAQKFADRIINFGQRHYYGSTWVPQNLKAGDVVRADLPTDFKQTGVPELWPRNCLVLGLDLDAETLDLKSIRLCPFSFNFTESNEQYEAILPSGFKGREVRSPLGRQAVLRTGRIDIAAPENLAFGFYIDRIPAIRPDYYDFYQHYLDLGFEKARQHRNLHLTETEGTIFVPSLDPADWENFSGFALPENETPEYQGTILSEMDRLARDTLADELYDKAVEMSYDRRHQMMDEVGLIYTRHRNDAKEQKSIREMVKAIRTKYSRDEANKIIRASKDRFDGLDNDLATRLREYMDAQASEKEVKIVPVPAFQTVIEEQVTALQKDTANKRKEALALIRSQEVNRDSLKDLENLGIGGLMREPSIRLPKQLWQGRYLLMRIPDLMNPENMENAYRPCAVWKAYAKVDQRGDANLAGLMLYPCTRGAAGAFKYKMHVHPFGEHSFTGDATMSKHARHMFKRHDNRPSFLIADMPVIAPVNSMYFQIDSDANFWQLPAHMVDKFAKKVEIAQTEMGQTQPVFGLQNIPEDWIEIELPPTPDHKMQKKLHGVQFVPATPS